MVVHSTSLIDCAGFSAFPNLILMVGKSPLMNQEKDIAETQRRCSGYPLQFAVCII